MQAKPNMSWVSAVSKKTGGRYYHNSTTNKSLWHDDALPAGWGWEQAGPDAPRVYVNMTTGEHSTVRPARTSTSVAVEVPGAHSPPSTDGVPEAPQLPALSATGLRSSAAAPIAEQEFAQLVAIITSGDDVDAVRALMSRVGSAVAISLLSNCTSEKLPVTALGLAAKLGRSRIIKVLLREFGAPVNARAEHSGYTALSLAAHAGHAAIVAALLAAGADPQALNRWNETPLRVAEKRGHATVVRLLQGAVAGGSSAAASATLAELLAPTAVRTDKGVALSLRGVRPGDQAALVRLYGVCQAGYRGPDGSAEAATHDHWTERVFATDFADAAAHYSSVPRGGLWVATVSRAEFGARSGGADPEPVLLLADADGAAEVVVGCVALVPWHEAPLEGGAPAASDSGGGGGGACELQRMCAHPALRRSGIATALIDLVEKRCVGTAARGSGAWGEAQPPPLPCDCCSAARLGYSHVQLTTLATMAPAVGLYAARGYTQVGPPGGTPVEFHGHVIYRTAFFKRLQQPAGAAAAAPAMVAPPAATPPAAADEPPPVLPHGTTYVPQGQVDAAIAAGPAAVHALAQVRCPATYERAFRGETSDLRPPLSQSVAARITAGEIPFPYKRRFTARAQVEGWFAELRALPSALELTAGPYALHGFLDRGRGVAVRVAAYTAAADGSGGAVVARRARIVADGPLRLGQAPPAAPAAAGAAGPASPPLPPLSVTSFAGCGPVRKPFDREFNERGGLLVDFYSEQARMRARRRDQALGPVDAWREPPAALAIAAKALRKFGAVTDDSLRHGQYGVLNACNLFHANLARALFGLFGARRILDPCAGAWGGGWGSSAVRPALGGHISNELRRLGRPPHGRHGHAERAALPRRRPQPRPRGAARCDDPSTRAGGRGVLRGRRDSIRGPRRPGRGRRGGLRPRPHVAALL